jgi:hypothetical protein
MKAFTWRRPYSIAVLLGCALAFARCDHETLAGSSVTTGNPTEIQVSFTGENGPVALSGRVDVYGATQVPIPGFSPDPLASFEVADQQDFRLASEDFASIPDSLWPVGSLEGDSLAHFNLVITGEGQGAIVRNLTLRKKAGEFVVGVASTLAARTKDIARMEVGLGVLSEHQAFIDPENLPANRLNYLFVKGTGFAAREEGGTFRFATLPEGDHTASFISLPDPTNTQGHDEDSAYVYNLDHPLSPGTRDTLFHSELDFSLVLPDLYKIKN